MMIASTWFVVLIVLLNCWLICVVQPSPLECSSCGDECTQSCGTRHFRTCCFNYLRKRSDPPRRPVATASTPAASMEREKGANTPPSESPAVDILSKTEVFQLRHLLRQLQSDWNSAVQNVAGSAGRHMDRSAVASYLAGLLLEPMQAFSSASAPPTFGLPLKSTSNTGPLISHNHLVDSGPTGGGRTTAAECYTLNGRRYCVESSMMELIGKS